MDPIIIDVPVSIRGYTTGGKGGTASHSTPLHRLTERRINGDIAACGTWFTGKIAVTEGAPKKKLADKYGVCQKCWPALEGGH